MHNIPICIFCICYFFSRTSFFFFYIHDLILSSLNYGSLQIWSINWDYICALEGNIILENFVLEGEAISKFKQLLHLVLNSEII